MRPFDASGNLVPPTDTGGGALRRSAVRGAGATLFAGGLMLVIQVGATMILARLLTPADFGLVAMVTTFSLLLVNFGYNGLTEAIVQRDDVTHDLASTLFWINVGFGVVLTLAFAACGPLLASFFHDLALRRVAAGISVTILITSFSTVHLALLKRTMRFTWVSVNDTCARVVSVVVSILLAWLGWHYWALVAGVIAQIGSAAIGAWIMCRWIPGRPKKVEGTGSMLNFALHTYGNFAVNYGSRNTDNLLVGWRFDAQSLGFYKKAYDLFALTASQFVSSISVVVVSALSRVRREPALYRRYLLDALAVMAFFGMGLGAGLTLVGKDLILLLLGPKWGPAGQIFTFFGPGVGIMILYCTHGWIHLSIGRADRWFRWAIVEFAVTCMLFLLGLQWGPVGIATAWSISFWVLTFPAIWYAGRPISLRITRVIAVVWRYVAASLFALPAATFAMNELPRLAAVPGARGAFERILVDCALVTPIYLGMVVLLHGGFAPLHQIFGLFRESMQWRRRSEQEAGAGEPARCRPAENESQEAAQGTGNAQAANGDVPLVSILIPSYNAQEWIADTIRSAIAQTWPRKEIIVVDDGSKDHSAEIARQFEPFGVRVVVQKNQGASAARNKAFSLCRGDYIQWLDADDLLAPDKIALQMELVMQGLDKRVLLSSAWGHFKYRTFRAEFVESSLWCDLTPQEWLTRKMSDNVFMQTATWLVSRELTEAAGPWDIRLLGDDDGEYFCRVLLKSAGTRFVRDSKVYYRAFRFDGLSYIGRFPEKIEAHWISMQLHIKYLRSLCDDARVRKACVQFLRDSLIYFYPESPRIVEQAKQLAAELGEPLGEPKSSWKYGWSVTLFGWMTTKLMQHRIRRFRWRMVKRLDYLLYRLEGRRQAVPALSPEAQKQERDALQTLTAKESHVLSSTH